jgi:hypothetical protein
MRNRFIISETEKKRILDLHEQTQSTGVTSLTPNDIVTTLTAMVSADPTMAAFGVKANELISTNKIFGPSTDLSKLTVDDILKLLQPYVTSNPQIVELIKKAINSLNPKLIFPGIKPVASAPATTQPIQLGVFNQKVQTIQKTLKEKYQKNLVVDGKWGPKTAAALKEVLDSKKGVVTPAKVVNPQIVEPAKTGEVKLPPAIDSSIEGTPIK